MTQDSFRNRVMAGDTVLGALVFEFFTPGIAQILQLAGCEYVLYDMEHTGAGFETLRRQTAACEGLDIVPLARVPRGEYHFLARALDIGMRGVMIPMVESAEEAARIVEATRYPPMGRRGAAFGFAHDGFLPGPPSDKIARANAEITVIAQIETERGLANVDAIAATEGIDVLWVGHFDMTNFLGIPGDFENPLFLDALQTVVAAGRKHGKGLAFMLGGADDARHYKDLGFNMLGVGTDHGLFMNGVQSVLQAVADS